MIPIIIYKGFIMKYVKSWTFTTEHESIQETLQEISDVIAIAKATIKQGDTKLALKNLDEAEHYIPYITRKVNIALQHVPESVQKKEFL